MLAEQARYVLAWRRERRIDQRWDEHLDDGLARPAMLPRVEVSAFHIRERRADDDARTQMRSVSRKTAELGQRGERDVYAKGRGRTAIGFDAAAEVGIERRCFDQPQIEELRIDVGDDAGSGDLGAVGEHDAGGAHA